METSTEVQSQGSKTRKEEVSSASSWLWVVALSAAGAVWIWAAFVRGRGYSHGSQFLLVLAILGALAAAVTSAGATLFHRQPRLLAFSCSSFLLLAVFLPEYLLGKPQAYFRSWLLLALAALLFAAYAAIVAGHGSAIRPGFLTPGLALGGFCLAYFAGTTCVTLSKLRAFGYVGQDIAYFTQCLYTSLHGRLFYSNMYHDLLYGKAVTSDFAGHNQPVLFLFVPFYALHRSASTLLVVRNISIVLCAWPVYLIAKRFLTPWFAVLAAIAFLLVPAVLYQNIYDFAPLSLAGLPLLFALYYFLEQRFWPYLIALACTQMVREDLVFAIFGLGLLALWQRRRWRWVMAPCVLAILWAILSWKIVFPFFLQGATSAVGSCFSYLGSTPGEMARSIFHHPRKFFSNNNLVYLKQMVEPLGGVLFLFNPAWIISLPYLAINVLGQEGGCNTAIVYRHYSLIPAVLLFASFLLGLGKFRQELPGGAKGLGSVRGALVLFVLAVSIGSTAMVTGSRQFQELETQPWHDEARRVANELPADAAVAVPRYMLPMVANRMSLYQSLRLLEYHRADAQFVVIDKDWKRMAATEQWRPNYDALRNLLATSPEYSVIYESPNYVIYKLCDGCSPTLPHRDPSKEMLD